MKDRNAIVLAGVILLAPLPAFAQFVSEAVTTEREMVVTAHPLATDAGAEALEKGGNAVDAMVAVQAVLGLVEPQSSGMGGGAFVVYFDAATGETTTFDGRETAPAAASETRFIGPDGEPLGFVDAWQSGLSAGVPGTPRLLEAMHDAHGRLPFGELLEPARELAANGFQISGRTSEQVAGLLARNPSCTDRLFFRDPVAFAYFTDGGTETCSAKPAGTLVTNPGYADLMGRLAETGADGFYEGPVAEAVAAAVAGDPHLPGDMTAADLAGYEVVEREPVCSEYRGYRVCGMGPPSSGAIAVGQILGILEGFDLGDAPLAPDVVHLFAQAGRLAFADRNLYVGDTGFVTVPVAGLLDEAYLAGRAALISRDGNDIGKAEAGTPPGTFDPAAPATPQPERGTSQVSIVDSFGNALSMTTTVESSFGNGVMVPGFGFLLNNELTDFSFRFEEDGRPIANRVQPGKRPRSSMSPTIVFDAEGEVFLVTGSPGGASIIGYTAQSIVNVIDFGLDPQQAIDVPHHQNRNGATNLEAPRPGVSAYDADALKAALEARGHEVEVGEMTSGLSVIKVDEGRLLGGADRRRDGTVGGR